MTLTEAAEWLRVSPRRLRTLAMVGRVPAVQVGESLRFDRATLIQTTPETPAKATASKPWLS